MNLILLKCILPKAKYSKRFNLVTFSACHQKAPWGNVWICREEKMGTDRTRKTSACNIWMVHTWQEAVVLQCGMSKQNYQPPG